jgi:co-chaperonin GroES (HSP10)
MPEKKTASGLIIADKSYNQLNAMTSDEPAFYRVLLTGAGYYDDTTKGAVPLETQPGDIVQMGKISVKVFSSFPLLEAYEADTIGITHDSEIQWRFKGEEAFTGLLDEFDRAIKEKISSRQKLSEDKR